MQAEAWGAQDDVVPNEGFGNTSAVDRLPEGRWGGSDLVPAATSCQHSSLPFLLPQSFKKTLKPVACFGQRKSTPFVLVFSPA